MTASSLPNSPPGPRSMPTSISACWRVAQCLEAMTSDLLLRDVVEADLAVFFDQHLDPQACWMASFTAKDPGNRSAFMARWQRLLSNATVRAKTIVFDGQVAGSVMS